MTFPVIIHLGPLALHPHVVFESLAYAIGAQLHWQLRRRYGDVLSLEPRMWIITAAAVGAVLGSKLAHWVADPSQTWYLMLHDPQQLIQGKSIIGGLLGGLLAVEGIKRLLHIRQPTGDLFAIPLAVGIAVGRIGCFLTGLADQTHGLPTSLPWGVDFGDGVHRHPTQLYEIVFLIGLAMWLRRRMGQPHEPGDSFKRFMIAYMSFRFAVEFLKPGVSMAGLAALQWLCLAALVYYRRDLIRLFANPRSA